MPRSHKVGHEDDIPILRAELYDDVTAMDGRFIRDVARAAAGRRDTDPAQRPRVRASARRPSSSRTDS